MTPRNADTGPLSPIEALDAKLDKILLHVGGGYDENGQHYPGLSHRVERLEEFVASIRRLIAGTVFAALAALAGAWALLGAGPRTPPGHP